MTKKEIIWRHILHQATTRQLTKFTQKELAAHFGFSLSTIWNALKIPRQTNAIEVTGKFFRVRDPEKLLLIWATHRNLKKDIIYTTHLDEPVQKIENSQPNEIIFGAYSAYRFMYKDAPADYDKVYVYSNDTAEIIRRFPKKAGYQNLLVLKPDEFLYTFGQLTPPAQTYVDIWNTEDWYAKDFLKSLKEKLDL